MPTAKSKSKKKAASRKKAGSSSAADLPKPLTIEQVKKRLKPREALAAPPAKPLVITQLLAGGDRVTVKVTSSEVEHARLSEPKAKAHQLNISVHGATLGVHAFPPTVRLKRFNANRRLLIPESGSNILDGKLPDHLPSRPFPKQLDRFLKVPPRIQAIRKGKSDKRIYEATTLFPPEDRYTFNDTSFPWCTTGRVETPGGIASGVMVGPRHLLTVSHTIQWNSDNTAGWVKFTPSYFDGSEPFGVAWGEWVYFEVKWLAPESIAAKGNTITWWSCSIREWGIRQAGWDRAHIPTVGTGERTGVTSVIREIWPRRSDRPISPPFHSTEMTAIHKNIKTSTISAMFGRANPAGLCSVGGMANPGRARSPFKAGRIRTRMAPAAAVIWLT